MPIYKTALFFLLLTIPGFAVAEDPWTVDEFIAETGVREGPISARELPGWNGNPTILLGPGPGITDDLALEFPQATFIVADNPAELLSKAAEADVIIGSCSAGTIAAARKLVWIQVFWAGVEGCLSIAEIASGDVLLTNMQKMSSPAIGEHAVAMALSLAHGLVQFGKAMPGGEWQRDLARTLGMYSVSGKTMLVAGLGGIGNAAAKRAHALGMRVLATRNSSREGPPWVDYVGLSDELDDLVGEADIIVNALPLTEATRGMFDAALFDHAKPGAYFINVGRGGTVVTADLVKALQSGRLAGAGLDVTDPEPLPADNPLWQMPNVIITPHVSGAGADGRLHAMLLRENIRRYLVGDALLNVVDPERGY